MGLLDEGKKVLGQALEKLPHFVIFLGLVAVGFSFTTFDKEFHFPTPTPNWILFFFGIGFIASGLVLHFITSEKKSKKLQDKTTLIFNSITLTIKIANLQDEENLTNDCAFVLPANTTFVDDCVTDNKSALGSFFNKHHSEKIPTFNEKLKVFESMTLAYLTNFAYNNSNVVLIHFTLFLIQ